MSGEQTRIALMEAAVRLTSRDGVRGLTARGIAGEAGVNQALVFYHFDGVDGLLLAAFDRATRAMIDDYAADLSGVTSFEDLYRVGARLAERSRDDGSAALLSHCIAAAQTDAAMAQSLAANLALWRDAVAEAVRRVLAVRNLGDAIDVEAVTGTLAASTIGMITLANVPGRPLGEPLHALRGLPGLLDRALRLLPAALTRRVLRGDDQPS